MFEIAVNVNWWDFYLTGLYFFLIVTGVVLLGALFLLGVGVLKRA